MKEIKDIAMWEETDSELAKYTIGKLQEENKELKRMCELYSKSLYNADLTKAEAKIDKAIETIEQLKQGSYIKYTDSTALAYHNPKPCCVARLDVIEDILRGKDNDNKTI